MNRYNVLVETTIEGTVYPASSIVELTEEVAASLVEAGNLELIASEEVTASEPVSTETSEPTASEEVVA